MKPVDHQNSMEINEDHTTARDTLNDIDDLRSQFRHLADNDINETLCLYKHDSNNNNVSGSVLMTTRPHIDPTEIYQPTLYHSNQIPSVKFRPDLYGRNVRLTSTCTSAYRISNEPLSHAYVFVNKQVKLNEFVCIQVTNVDLANDANRSISLSFGCTNCNLNQLFQNDLPVDSYSLLNRQEYWVVNKNILNNAQSGDELCFKLNENGRPCA
jgi:hypothetical protein